MKKKSYNNNHKKYISKKCAINVMNVMLEDFMLIILEVIIRLGVLNIY